MLNVFFHFVCYKFKLNKFELNGKQPRKKVVSLRQVVAQGSRVNINTTVRLAIKILFVGNYRLHADTSLPNEPDVGLLFKSLLIIKGAFV